MLRGSFRRMMASVVVISLVFEQAAGTDFRGVARSVTVDSSSQSLLSQQALLQRGVAAWTFSAPRLASLLRRMISPRTSAGPGSDLAIPALDTLISERMESLLAFKKIIETVSGGENIVTWLHGDRSHHPATLLAGLKAYKSGRISRLTGLRGISGHDGLLSRDSDEQIVRLLSAQTSNPEASVTSDALARVLVEAWLTDCLRDVLTHSLTTTGHLSRERFDQLFYRIYPSSKEARLLRHPSEIGRLAIGFFADNEHALLRLHERLIEFFRERDGDNYFLYGIAHDLGSHLRMVSLNEEDLGQRYDNAVDYVMAFLVLESLLTQYESNRMRSPRRLRRILLALSDLLSGDPKYLLDRAAFKSLSHENALRAGHGAALARGHQQVDVAPIFAEVLGSARVEAFFDRVALLKPLFVHDIVSVEPELAGSPEGYSPLELTEAYAQDTYVRFALHALSGPAVAVSELDHPHTDRVFLPKEANVLAMGQTQARHIWDRLMGFLADTQARPTPIGQVPSIEVVNPKVLENFEMTLFLWDFDNTIWSGFPHLEEERLWAAWAFGTETPSPEQLNLTRQFFARCQGLNRAQTVAKWTEEGNPNPGDFDDFVPKLEEAIDAEVLRSGHVGESSLVPGAKEFLEAVHARRIAQKIVTGGHRERRWNYAGLLGVARYFEGIHGGEPKETVVQQYVDQLGAQHVAVIGDGTAEIIAAKQAGALAIGFAQTPEKRAALLAAGADVIINRDFRALAEILKVLKLSTESRPPVKGSDPTPQRSASLDQPPFPTLDLSTDAIDLSAVFAELNRPGQNKYHASALYHLLGALDQNAETQRRGLSSIGILRGELLNVGLETTAALDEFVVSISPNNLVAVLRPLGVRIVGLDPLVEDKPREGYYQGVVQRMSMFADNSFNSVLSVYLFDPIYAELKADRDRQTSSLEAFYETAAGEIKRVLKSGGVFLADFQGTNKEFLAACERNGFEIISLGETIPGEPLGYLLINHKSPPGRIVSESGPAEPEKPSIGQRNLQQIVGLVLLVLTTTAASGDALSAVVALTTGMVGALLLKARHARTSVPFAAAGARPYFWTAILRRDRGPGPAGSGSVPTDQPGEALGLTPSQHSLEPVVEAEIDRLPADQNELFARLFAIDYESLPYIEKVGGLLRESGPDYGLRGFTSRASTYNEILELMKGWGERLAPKSMLELGPGPGLFLLALKKLGAHADGLETNPDFVNLARSEGVSMMQGSLLQPPPEFYKHPYDITFSRDVLDALLVDGQIEPAGSHRLGPAALEQLARLTKIGGLSIHIAERGFPFNDEDIRSAGFEILFRGQGQNTLVLRRVELGSTSDLHANQAGPTQQSGEALGQTPSTTVFDIQDVAAIMGAKFLSFLFHVEFWARAARDPSSRPLTGSIARRAAAGFRSAGSDSTTKPRRWRLAIGVGLLWLTTTAAASDVTGIVLALMPVVLAGVLFSTPRWGRSLLKILARPTDTTPADLLYRRDAEIPGSGMNLSPSQAASAEQLGESVPQPSAPISSLSTGRAASDPDINVQMEKLFKDFDPWNAFLVLPTACSMFLILNAFSLRTDDPVRNAVLERYVPLLLAGINQNSELREFFRRAAAASTLSEAVRKGKVGPKESRKVEQYLTEIDPEKAVRIRRLLRSRLMSEISPSSVDNYIEPFTEAAELGELLGYSPEDILVYGLHNYFPHTKSGELAISLGDIQLLVDFWKHEPRNGSAFDPAKRPVSLSGPGSRRRDYTVLREAETLPKLDEDPRQREEREKAIDHLWDLLKKRDSIENIQTASTRLEQWGYSVFPWALWDEEEYEIGYAMFDVESRNLRRRLARLSEYLRSNDIQGLGGVIEELFNNFFKYAFRAVLLVRVVPDGLGRRVEMVALDSAKNGETIEPQHLTISKEEQRERFMMNLGGISSGAGTGLATLQQLPNFRCEIDRKLGSKLTLALRLDDPASRAGGLRMFAQSILGLLGPLSLAAGLIQSLSAFAGDGSPLSIWLAAAVAAGLLRKGFVLRGRFFMGESKRPVTFAAHKLFQRFFRRIVGAPLKEALLFYQAGMSDEFLETFVGWHSNRYPWHASYRRIAVRAIFHLSTLTVSLLPIFGLAVSMSSALFGWHAIHNALPLPSLSLPRVSEDSSNLDEVLGNNAFIVGHRARDILRRQLESPASQALFEPIWPQDPFFDPDALEDRLVPVIRSDLRISAKERSLIVGRLQSLCRVRPVGFRSLVLGSKILEGLTDQWVLGFKLPEPVSATRVPQGPVIGYATDLLPWLYWEDRRRKTTLMDEYFLSLALQGMMRPSRVRTISKILFPKNYPKGYRSGLLQPVLETFILRNAVQRLRPNDLSADRVKDGAVQRARPKAWVRAPDQFTFSESEGWQALPLTHEALIHWKSGQPLAPGRTLRRSIGAGQSSVKFAYRTNEFLFRVPAKPRTWNAVFHSFEDPNQGVMVGAFEEETFTRWIQGDLAAVPAAVYAMSEPHGDPRKANPFIQDLQRLRRGLPVAVRPDGHPWKFMPAHANIVVSGQRGSQTWVELHLEAFGVKNLRLYLDKFSANQRPIQNGEPLIVALLEDPNHGSIAQVFRTGDFDFSRPSRSKNPLVTYVWVRSNQGWMPVDLATLDIAAWATGRTDLKGLGRRKEVSLINGSQPLIQFQLKDQLVRFKVTAEEVKDYHLTRRPIYIEIMSDPVLGAYATVYVLQGRKRQILRTNMILMGRSTPVDLSWLTLTRYIRGMRDIKGDAILPRIYRSPTAIPEALPEIFWRIEGQTIAVRGLVRLLKGRSGSVFPIFVPKRDPGFGWRFEIHDQRDYDQDPNREPDLILVRHPQRVALVPLEQVEKMRPNDDDQRMFETMATQVGLRDFLRIGVTPSKAFVAYLTRVLQSEFGLKVRARKVPLLFQTWLLNLVKTSERSSPFRAAA